MAGALSLKESIYNAILEDIFTNEYKPNQILNEKSLVEKYGCSKSPVREALVSLCNDHVLRNIPRYGYEVVKLTAEDVREMLQFRYVLESGMLVQCIRKFTPPQIKRLEAVNEQCRLDSDDVWKHWSHNSEFHRKLLAVCGSRFAVEELCRCMDRLKRAYAQFYWDSWDAASPPIDTRNHALILQSLKQGDLDGAIACLKDDLNDFGGMNDWF